MLKYISFKPTIKYVITLQTPKLLLKKCTFFFFSSNIKMSRKNTVFDHKKVISTKIKDYSRQMKWMLTKYQFQKKNHMVQISQLNVSLE